MLVIPTYMLILTTVAWRSIVCARSEYRGISLFGSHQSYCKLAGLSFLASDAILALTSITGIIGPSILSTPIAHFLVLSTYYFSQFCFTKFVL